MNAHCVALCACAVIVSVGCEPEPPEEPFVRDCEADSECSGGNLCIDGDCVLAECNPALEEGEDRCGADVVDRAGCCRIIDNCNALTRTCVRDPSFVGPGCVDGVASCVSCLDSDDCPNGSDICADGRCHATAGLDECGQEAQCPAGAHCDLVELFCVPDACSRCSPELPGLCCGADEVCDAASDTCIGVDDECTVATEDVDCRPGAVCNATGRCVFCLTNDDCGPGTVCSDDVGGCVGAVSACNTDDDCIALNPILRCIASTCAAPQCTTNEECFDPRESCTNFQCVLPPAVCAAEADEPNNNFASAVALDDVNAVYAGSLCRGDTDFISFPVQPQRRYTVTVTIANDPFGGITASLFNTTGGRESDATFGFASVLPVLGVTGPGETGRFVVGVSAANANQLDTWRYTLTVAEAPAAPEPDCSPAGVINHEPNDSAETATALSSGAALDVSRCGADDVDFFTITVPPQHSVQVVVDNFLNDEGNLNPSLLRGPPPGVAVIGQSPTGTVNSETLIGPEGTVDYLIKVSLATSVGALPSQSYRIVATTLPRPAACDVDVGEDDDAFERARPLSLTTTDGLVAGSVSPLRCNVDDVDHHSFTLPARLGGTLRLTSTQGAGDLALQLLDAAGAVLLTSNGVSGSEAIDLPQALVDVPFVARVSLATTASPNSLAQPYTLSVSSFSAGVCLDDEPTADNTFATARCIGDFDVGTFPCNGPVIPLGGPVLAACAADDTADGCSRSCGSSDVDVYRIGTLAAGRSVTAHLEFDPAAGDLAVAIAKVTNGVASVDAAVGRDLDTDGVVDFEFLTANAPKEHIILVRPQGTLGHEAQLYALAVDVSDACVDDVFDAAGSNATPATATPLRPDPTSGEADIGVDGSICSDDVDVYGLLGLQNEELTWRLVGRPGLRLRVGTAPANLNDPAIPLPGGEVVVDVSGSATLTLVSARVQQLFVTIDDSVAGAGADYALTVDFTP